MRKLFVDVRVGVLGAAAGLLSSSVFLMLARIDAYYAYLQHISDDEYYRGVEDLWWLPISFWHVVLSIAASLVAHRYLSPRDKPPFLLWQSVGLIVLLGWALTLAVGVGLESIRIGSLSSMEHAFALIRPWSFVKFASTVFACHVLFGSAMHAASRQYQTAR